MGTGDDSVDWYSFNVPGPDYAIVIDIDYGEGSGGDIDGYLYLTDGVNDLAENDDSEIELGMGGSTNTLDTYLEYIVQSGGTYYVEVSECCSGPVGAGGTYELQISIVAPDSGLTNEVEPNNTTGAAQNIDGEPFTTAFNPFIGDNTANTSTTIPHISIIGTGDGTSADIYSFTITTPGSRVLLDTDFGYTGAGWSGGTADADTYLVLYDTDGSTILDTADDSGALSDGGGSGHPDDYDSFIDYTFSTPGVYYVEVTECCTPGNSIPLASNYVLQVSIPAAAPAAPATPVPTMTQWGMIVFIMLAGFVSVFYLRRRNKA
ncbi:MAG: hypothetical protein GY864_08990 [Desulfobacterales bacterium]|nr:hypothetical protein [Desulfobacterales bacterium]